VANRRRIEAHLAALIRLENTAVLLGAGSSMGPLGGRSMADLWKDYKDSFADSADWLLSEKFVAEDTSPNIENLLDTIEVAKLEWCRARRAAELIKLQAALDDLYRIVVKVAVLNEECGINPN